MADRKKMEGHISTGQSPQWDVVPMEEEEEEEEEEEINDVSQHMRKCGIRQHDD